jgi:hypothetical protein
VSVSHRVKFDGDSVKEMMGVAKDKLQTYKEAAAFLGSKRFTDESVTEYFGRVFGAKEDKKTGEDKNSRNARIAYDILEQQPGANFAKGSWWQAFNASTFMVDHVIGRNEDNRMNSAWFGWGRNLKVKALQTAMEMAALDKDITVRKVKAPAAV